MRRNIRKAAVLGSGVMGASIAAHLANVGIPSLMLDIVPKERTEAEKAKGLNTEDDVVRNRLGNEALKALMKKQPAPFTAKENSDLIEVGNMTDDIARLGEADWIIEVVVEQLSVKQNVYAQVDKYRKPGTIVSSNTSGISLASMAKDRSEDFRQHFLGTHFYNPPRYMKLLEIIPTKDTDPDVIKDMLQFRENGLGKGTVQGKDTPNFIGNRIGVYSLFVTIWEMMKSGYDIGEVDSVTGPLIGRPKSATFRTLDVVGLDTLIDVANNMYHNVDGKEKAAFRVPDFVQKMYEKGWVGSKAGQGFYLKKKDKDGHSEILQLNRETFDYEPRGKLKTKAVETAKQKQAFSESLKTLSYADGDRAGQLIWRIMKSTLLYTAEKTYEIADDIVAIDKAMKWGFGWEYGPFEIWDALGVEDAVARMKSEGETIPAWVEEMLHKGYKTFYHQENGQPSFYHNGAYQIIHEHPKDISLHRWHSQHRVIDKNKGASLLDLDDGVALLAFHSKSNALGLDTIQMLEKALAEVEKNYKGLLIGNQGKNFCVGANIALMLLEAQDENFLELDRVVNRFQQAMANIRYAEKPVVVAPFQMAVGGGVEISLPADAIQASAETYMGFVEPGVGLIPGGGGNKEFLLRELEKLPDGVDIDLTKISNYIFETIAMAKVSTSAQEAKKYGFLRERDGISVNGDHLLYEAKQRVIQLADAGYRPPKRVKIPVSGEPGYGAMLMGAESMKLSGYVSEHDMKIAKKLAYVLAGGRLPEGAVVSEQYLLDLEREAFLSLLGEPKTQARMQHMLTKGKPLRN